MFYTYTGGMGGARGVFYSDNRVDTFLQPISFRRQNSMTLLFIIL